MSAFPNDFITFAAKETIKMKVCIAEKPSVARDIARILGANI